MEFLRFGSQRGGQQVGCCGVDIIQGFGSDPDSMCIDEPVNGDSFTRLRGPDNELLYLGKTYRDVFWARLRIGTFIAKEMPDRGFIAIITDSQLRNACGMKWLAILREAGFEFIRTVNNSYYTTSPYATTPHPMHVFALFRNVSVYKIEDPFTPPKAWTNLPQPKSQEEIWEAHKGDYEKAMGKMAFLEGPKAEVQPAIKAS